MAVFSADRSASLAEVAERAQVARSTLHRYFPERSDLMEAISAYAKEQVREVGLRARMEEGLARDALLRLCLEYFERWEAVMWDYMESGGETAVECEDDTPNVSIAVLIARGRAEGAIDPTLPDNWIQHAMFAMVYSAWEYSRSNHPRHEAAMHCVNSFQKLIAPPQLPTAATGSNGST